MFILWGERGGGLVRFFVYNYTSIRSEVRNIVISQFVHKMNFLVDLLVIVVGKLLYLRAKKGKNYVVS